MELVLATSNVHKICELREMFKPVKGLELLSLRHFADYISPEETGKTFQENALIKGRDAAVRLNQWVLADDSGLVVPRLHGNPGVHSRRYAGAKATDGDNCRKLLQEMQHLIGPDRTAYFECCLALCGPDGTEKSVTGIVEGTILTEIRGSHGFGYDSLFLKHDYNQTFAELPPSAKDRISHRFKAFQKILTILEGNFL